LLQCIPGLAGDIGDISDVQFDTIGTQIKNMLKYLQETVNKKF
jgi:hypothetical protein